jgi:hypothetical protein
MNRVLHFSGVILFVVLSIAPSGSIFSQTFPIKVAIFNDDGVGTGDPAKFEACITDTNLYTYTEVSGTDIRAGILNNFDMLLVPGGSGSGQAASLQAAGLDSIRSFVYRGGGYYGTCGGAYLASAAYSWSLRILNAKGVDAAHWDRGHGPVVINFTNEGKDFYSIAQDTITIIYWQGPLMAPGAVDTLPAYVKLATFATEIAENGAIPGAMIGATAFAQSCFGKGRVIIHSPHPEMTTGLDYMVRAAVNWAANKASFTKFATPLESEQWNAGASQAIQWISGNGVDTMKINYSTDNGGTWTQISSASVNWFDWVVPNTPSTSCKLRINSINRAGIGDTVSFVILPPLPTITSIASGSWNATGTWDTGVLPDSLHNVVIVAGHTVTVNAPAYCNNISFGDTTARLALNANLSIFGNFNRYNTTVNPFYSTTSLWTAGAKLIFTGSAAQQTINNLGTTSTSPYPFRLDELVIDKSEGKFTTGTGYNYKLGIGTSLEVRNGTFELGSTDDMEGRNVANTSTYPTILVDSGAVFTMMGSSSYIRRGNFTGEETGKIGKMTIFGDAYLACGSSNRISFKGIDVENGGTLYIPTGRGWTDSTFNPGTVTIKDGGLLKSSINTLYWYPNTTTPTTLVVNSGGEYYSTPTVISLPPVVTLNSGSTMRFYSTAASTLPAGVTTYENLILTGTSVKSLGVNTKVNGTLTIQSSASLNLNSKTLTYGPSATLQYGYSSQTAAQTTTDNEWPATGGPSNVTIYNKNNVSLHSSRSIAGTLKFTSGSLLTGSNTLQLGDTAVVSGEKAGSYVIGKLTTVRNVGTGTSSFGGVGVSIAGGADNIGNVTVTRVSGTNGVVQINAKSGIARNWTISSDNPPAQGRDVTLAWIATDDNGVDLTKSQIYGSSDGTSWSAIGNTSDASGRSVTFTANAFGQYTVNTSKLTSANEQVKSSLPKEYTLFQNYPNPFNPATIIKYAVPADARVTLELYNVIGQKVATLVSKDVAAGYYEYNVNMNSYKLASGMYIYKFSSTESTTGKQFTMIKKMMYLK